MSTTEDTFATDLYNMVMSGLLALHSAQLAGSVSRTTGSETIFLGKWLKLAKKQKRFPKIIAGEIDNLLKVYSIKGKSSNLIATFNEIFEEFQVCKIKQKEFPNSPKSRFDSSMDLLKKQEWFITLPLVHDFNNKGPYQPIQEKEVFVTDSDWQDSFDENDQLNKALSIYVVSKPQEVIDCFYAHGFILAKVKSGKKPQEKHHQFKVFPNNEYTGSAAIPSQVK